MAQKLAYDLSGPRTEGRSIGLVPYVVTLRSFETWLSTGKGDLVIDYIESNIRKNLSVDVPPGAVHYILESGNALVVFDGLDELLDIGRRREMSGIVESFGSAYPASTILVTSRRIGYDEAPLRPSEYSRYLLGGFSEADVQSYAHAWFNLDDQVSEEDSSAISVAFLRESAPARDLRTNALMLGLMCNLYRGTRYIPQNRADLYEKCAEMLFERWDMGRGIVSASTLRSDVRMALLDVALWMFSDPILAEGILEKDLVKRVSAYMGKRYEDREEALARAQSLVNLWKGRLWILTDVGSSTSSQQLKFKFTHQTFLEYFAAVELVRKNPSPSKLWRVLRKPLETGSWEIVAQIAIQRLDDYSQDGADAFVQLVLKAATAASLGPKLNLLRFCARNVDTLRLMTSTVRQLTRICVGTAIAVIGDTSDLPRSPASQMDAWRSAVSRLGVNPNSAWAEGAAEMAAPFAELSTAPTETRTIVQSEVVDYAADIFFNSGTSESARAFAFLADMDDLPGCAEFAVELGRTARDRVLCAGSLDRVAQRLAAVVSTCAWTVLAAYRAKLIRAADVAQLSRECMFCDWTAFGGRRSAPSLAESVMYTYFDLPVKKGRRSDMTRDEARETLGSWLSEDDGLDWSIHGNWIDRTRLVADLLEVGDRPTRERSANVAFGAAVLLAVFFELAEELPVRQLQEQDLEYLLEPIGDLSPVFAARVSSGMEDVVDEALEASLLAGWQKYALSNWANGEVDLVERVY